MITNAGELHLHYGEIEPAALRVELSGVFAALRALDSGWTDKRLRILERELNAGRLDQAKFDLMRDRLLLPPARVEVPEAEQMGTCPSCSGTIPLKSTECPKCQATFGHEGGWRVRPG
jgi:hypothetical protein